MEHSVSADDGSDANETLSAPSEFLAEFLSAIMQRQYAEALKYCRLILQYEPHNATARGFYPLLEHKLHAHAHQPAAQWRRADSPAPSERGSSSETSAPRRAPPEEMQQEGSECGSEAGSESSGSCGAQSSLELDSSDAREPSPDTTGTGGAGASGASGTSGTSSGGAWGSAGTDTDDNGNPPPRAPLHPDDVENENGTSAGDLLHSYNAGGGGGGAASLRRLRARFACSTK